MPLLAAATVVGCGEETASSAVEATEANAVELDGVTYRVPVFRELNVRTTPDDGLWKGGPPADGANLYGVFVRSCAEGSEPGTMSRRIHLEDAFGQRFAPQTARTAPQFRYAPATLEPGRCAPRDGSLAEQVAGGQALVFELPLQAIRERPLVLEIDAASGDEERRIELSL